MRGLVIVVVVASGHARADYPRALVDRPLVLPAGTIEGELALGLEARAVAMATETTSFARARTTYGDGRLDVELATTVALDPDDAHPDRLDVVRFGARFEAVTDLVVAPSVAYAGSTLSPRIAVVHRRVRGRGGIELAAATGIDDGLATHFVVGGSVRVRAQIAAPVALEGRAALSYLYDAAADKPELHHRFAQDFGMRALWSATPVLDAFAAIDLLAFDDDVKLFTLGIALRGGP